MNNIYLLTNLLLLFEVSAAKMGSIVSQRLQKKTIVNSPILSILQKRMGEV